MVDSTTITSRISNPKGICDIALFLNRSIASGYGARIIKNVGNSLIYYFPETSDVSKWSGFKGVLESTC